MRRVQRWQVLQDADPTARIVAPYERSPQVGVRWLSRRRRGGFELAASRREVNRFTLPAGDADPTRADRRARARARQPSRGRGATPGWWLDAEAGVQRAPATALDQPLADGRRSASRVIPTFSVDSGCVFERDTQLVRPRAAPDARAARCCT